MDQHLNDTYDEQAALNPVFLFAYTLLQVPKTVLADHMLHAADILLCCPWIDTCLRQQVGKEAVFLIGLLLSLIHI